MDEDKTPPLVPVGFKEWSSVCAAIGAGRQRIILRKGGIAEGRTGFSFKHDRFFLFPTLFHEQSSSIREQFEVGSPPTEEWITMRLFVEVVWKGELEDWEAVKQLEPLHIWKEQVIRERFLYGKEAGQGSVQLAVLQAWDLGEAWRIPHHRSYGGCRSWLDLPEIPKKISDLQLQKIEDPKGRDYANGVLNSIGVSVSE